MSDDDPISQGYASWDAEKQARYDAARDRAAAAIAEMAAFTAEEHFPDDPPYVQGWVTAVEFTNIELERDNAGGRYVFMPHGQMLSIGAGLARWAESRFV